MRLEHDKEADALYIWLRELPLAFGLDLDQARHTDYADDQAPIGFELLNVSKGVNLDDLPERAGVERLWAENDIKINA